MWQKMAELPSLARRIARSGVLPLCRWPLAWGRATRQPPGLPLALCRAFSNNKILVELDESSGVATMKLKSPPVNSLSLDFLTELCISLEKLENDRACRGVILTSAVPKIFSSGLDITEMCGKSMEHYAEFWRAVQEMWLRVYGSNMVTVAAVNGSSPAGGCLLALSCDYRIMVENPKFSIGLNEAQLGIVAPFWFKDTFTNVVGYRVAERSLQLGSLHPAPEAHKFGLVDELVPEEKLQEKAAAVMAQWLALPDQSFPQSGTDHNLLYGNLSSSASRRPCPSAHQVHDEEGGVGPPGSSPRGGHSELRHLHLKRVHPEVTSHVHGDAKEEEELRSQPAGAQSQE